MLQQWYLLMVFQSLCQLDGVIIVIVLHRVTQGLVVLFLNQQIIDCIVYNLVVLRLHRQKEWLDEGNATWLCSMLATI